MLCKKVTDEPCWVEDSSNIVPLFPSRSIMERPLDSSSSREGFGRRSRVRSIIEVQIIK